MSTILMSIITRKINIQYRYTTSSYGQRTTTRSIIADQTYSCYKYKHQCSQYQQKHHITFKNNLDANLY